MIENQNYLVCTTLHTEPSKIMKKSIFVRCPWIQFLCNIQTKLLSKYWKIQSISTVMVKLKNNQIVGKNKLNSVVETIQAENNRKLSQDWKLSKRVTLPEDCNLDTIDVVCDKKKTVVRITCDKIPGHFRCGTSSRAGSRTGNYQ